MTARETFSFQTEGKQLLDLMIHSVYSNREIFLRELISNASDALDKLRVAALTDEKLSPLFADAHIRIALDGTRRLLSVEDNGIGMNRDDLIAYLGTIAKSGTKEFIQSLAERREALTAELIGQFGVGFYSSFMVADSVEVLTRKAGDEAAWLWTSSGDGTYSLEEASREGCGTTVTLHLKSPEKDEEGPAGPDFTDRWTIGSIVRKYSDFVAYPIRMETETFDDEGKVSGTEDKVLNSMKAIWARPESEVSDEEYREFYAHVSRDGTDPLRRIVYSAEGVTSFRALLYLPAKAPLDLFLREGERGIHLYVKRVFIMQDCKELIPEYLRFLRGVVDSEDLPLNLSREILQQDRQIAVIRRSLTRKVLDELKRFRDGDREGYLSFWKEFGKVLKEGIFADERNRESLLSLALFCTTEREWITLDEYLASMKPEQKALYHLSGGALEGLRRSPHIEAFRERGYEVLLLDDPVDDFWIDVVDGYGEKPFKSVAKGTADLEEKPEEKAEAEEREKAFAPLLEALSKSLGEEVASVRLSKRLRASLACLVGETHSMTPQMEQLFRSMGQPVPKLKRVLEVNGAHPVLERLRNRFEKDGSLGDYPELLLGQAILAEGGKLADPARFSRLVADLLVRDLDDRR
ncbi:molecular chaperone HtpG [Aminithiophilus ramosus]|uniref:Chaperone protein HtpG n=2 Tax=Synergistales TaxID=649776 RepID=A0A9Q7EY12_9BACT|nr:molecular chaperone HtpG [Aminithiophilus ramosus]QTX31541.1 molecular chaperone HtpG [Aminithiophilus ramosus]QVL35348.1 molecular chaperone HtpG [Synergistota bacterium]